MVAPPWCGEGKGKEREKDTISPAYHLCRDFTVRIQNIAINVKRSFFESYKSKTYITRYMNGLDAELAKYH